MLSKMLNPVSSLFGLRGTPPPSHQAAASEASSTTSQSGIQCGGSMPSSASPSELSRATGRRGGWRRAARLRVAPTLIHCTYRHSHHSHPLTPPQSWAFSRLL
ncbi:unnamed protein product [Vitrella brassicaformis CCMP3155]|uniref:Uncharacterized protein n=1 Tax=Vitrella brassicaformis (strain CCMP3155) TaxID=1169540 RepID=A0A0G4EV83_VITBC|nr:unnamed protein product [Vitrella brassicaformis CCMP3155]|eukprot:CEM02531.1 unnamed protein product [Vitrella brassicaformis CCMP3155]